MSVSSSNRPVVVPPPVPSRRVDSGVAVSSVPATPALIYTECQVSDANPDGSVHVTFLMPPDVTRRMRLRAGKMDLAKYLWENVLHQATESHVY